MKRIVLLFEICIYNLGAKWLGLGLSKLVKCMKLDILKRGIGSK